MNMQRWGLGTVDRSSGDLNDQIAAWQSKLQTLQTKAAADSQFWAGDWRLGIAEERVMLAEERLAAVEMTISSRLSPSSQAPSITLISKGL